MAAKVFWLEPTELPTSSVSQHGPNTDSRAGKSHMSQWQILKTAREKWSRNREIRKKQRASGKRVQNERDRKNKVKYWKTLYSYNTKTHE
mmetsp:Transcript_13129/g.19103  ORF Transcript_13129/g.19103 Transcript_13129/m.19103 type:complete len:90 (+) Transcript_13129:182-451(+)